MLIRDLISADKSMYFNMTYDFYEGDAVLFPIKEENIEATFHAALTHSPYMRTLIFEEQGQIAGYALLAFYWSCEAGGMVTLLEEFYLKPAYRGQKLGSQFMDWLMANYLNTSKRLRLEVCPNNPRAIKLYESYGFEVLDYIQMIR